MKDKMNFALARNTFITKVKLMKRAGVDHDVLQELCVDCVREMTKTPHGNEARRQIFRLGDFLATEGIDVSASFPEETS